jgi:hypothetical protein
MKHPWLLAALACAVLPLAAQTWRARPSDNYRPNRNDGRFDLRVRVNGPTECRIQWDTVECRLRGQGDAPRDAGSEMNTEVPRATLNGLRLEQRDGRSRMTILEEPSRRNGWAIIVRIEDNFRRGDDGRHHARITWDGSSGGDWSGGGRPGGGGWGDSGRPGGGGGWGSGGGAAAPAWAVGRFTARPRGASRDIEVEINQRGEIRSLNNDRWRGDIDGRRMRLEGETYEIERISDGFLARSRRDGDAIVFRRY